MTEMHDVVEMLLSRMRNYPEDFYGVDPGRDFVHNKWIEALNIAKQVMRPEEKAAVESELEKAKRAVYMGAALKTMIGPDEPVQEDVMDRKNRIINPSMATTGVSQSQLLPSSATTTTVNTGYISKLEAQLKQMEYDRQQAKVVYAQRYPISGSALG